MSALIYTMGYNGYAKENGSKILRGIKVAFKHFVLDFEDPQNRKQPKP